MRERESHPASEASRGSHPSMFHVGSALPLHARRKIYIDLEKDGAVGFQVIATNGVANLTSRGVVKPVTQTCSVMRTIGVLARISM